MAELPYWADAQQYGNEYGVDPKLIEAVMHQESGGNPAARSPAGAEGLMQFMPGTAAGLHINPWDPSQAIHGAAEYLQGLLRHFHGNVDEALAGYNAGQGAVDKYHGIPPYRETQDYVRDVEAGYKDIGGTAQSMPEPPHKIDFSAFGQFAATTMANISATADEWFTSAPFIHSVEKALMVAKPWQSFYQLMTK